MSLTRHARTPREMQERILSCNHLKVVQAWVRQAWQRVLGGLGQWQEGILQFINNARTSSTMLFKNVFP